MRRNKGPNHPVARRAAMASLTVLAASGVGLVAAPMAFGQIVIPIGGSSQGANVTNSGSASANSGGNVAIGNTSTNSAGSTSLLGGVLDVPLALGAPTNNSDGTAVISSGPATATGNSAETGVAQSTASGNQVTGFLVGQQQQQSAGVTNAGSASANTGGNTAIGNGSNNRATTTQEVSGGLLGVGVNLGGPTNNSTGTAAINSGAANATGNSSGTNVGQASQGGTGGGGVLASPRVVGGPGGGPGVGGVACSSGRPGTTFQNVNVRNQGQAQANTGDNVAIGNGSTNNATATVGQTVSGGLLGLGISVGGPVNNSSGTAVINTGPANAVGNESTTQVTQVEGCPQVTTLIAGRQVVVVPATVRQGTLARTGLETSDLGMIAGGLLGLGVLLIASQRRRLAARSATVPMAGLGFGLGGNDWDGAVR